MENKKHESIVQNLHSNIKIKTGEIIPMPCPKCGGIGINRISMSAYNNNGFKCVCGFEVDYV